MDSSKIPGNHGSYPASFKYTPLEALRNLFVGFLQGIFAAAPPGAYHWDQDRNATDIIIQDEAPTEEETMQQKPLITLTRGPLQFYSFGMDDMLSYDQDIDRKTKSILVPGTMSVNCLSRTSLEAENIAWVVAEHLWLLREILIKNGLFDTGRQITVGGVSPAGSIIADDNGSTWYLVAVTVPFQFVRTSSFTPLGKEIVQNIEARFAYGFEKHKPVGPLPETANAPLSVYRCPPPTLIPSSDARGGTATAVPTHNFLPKQRHPLYPDRQVFVRVVRPNIPGLRPYIPSGQGQVPIPTPCMEESPK